MMREPEKRPKKLKKPNKNSHKNNKTQNQGPDDPGEAPTPKKLEYRYTGPHAIYHAPEDDKRFRYILHVGRKKVMNVNVNRLRPWHPWSNEHLYTDPPVPTDEEKTSPLTGIDMTLIPNEGDLILVPSSEDKEPFYIARLLRRRPDHQNGHLVQWMSNYSAKTFSTYRPGWLQNNKHYFRAKRTSPQHQPYTNDTNDTLISDENIYPKTVILNPNGTLDHDLIEHLKKDTSLIPDMTKVHT
jgi:hypothetical protein